MVIKIKDLHCNSFSTLIRNDMSWFDSSSTLNSFFSCWYVSSFIYFLFSYPRKKKICFIISKYPHKVPLVVFSWWAKRSLPVLNISLFLLCLLNFKLYGYAPLLISYIISIGWVLKPSIVLHVARVIFLYRQVSDLFMLLRLCYLFLVIGM